MSFFDYFKERWLGYLFLLIGFVFAYLVYQLDSKINMTQSNANYLIAGLLILLMIFITTDYFMLRSRMNRFKSDNAFNMDDYQRENQFYPMDQAFTKTLLELSNQYEMYQAEIATQSAEQIEFITKWVHDIKVPIAALRLMLETNENDLSANAYASMDMELTRIEQSALMVLYNLKANAFHNDYKISQANTQSLIAQSLKAYSTFFSYKRIAIRIHGENQTVLTDEKWSTYILSQIISNAVKYTPVEGKIDITTKKSNQNVTISIRNVGQGIQSRDLPQIFNKGYTASIGRNGSKSTGYGLYLSNKLAKMLGHQIKVESVYGEYAQFDLVFDTNQTTYVTKLSS